MKDVTIAVDQVGFGTFVVGGVDISDRVTEVRIYIKPGRPTDIEFDVVGDVMLDAKGAEVTVSRSA